MRMIATALIVSGLGVGAWSCWSSASPPPADPVKPVAAPVEIAIASVSLADDCGDDAHAQAEMAPQGSMAGDCDGDCGMPRACEQSRLQVSFRSSGTESAAIAIRRIELLDASGKVVGTLTARSPQRWGQSGSYVAWNQMVAGGELLSASYALTAPDWGKLPGGRDPTARYKVRVTFAVGGGEKTVEKQAVVSAFSDPNVVT